MAGSTEQEVSALVVHQEMNSEEILMIDYAQFKAEMT